VRPLAHPAAGALLALALGWASGCAGGRPPVRPPQSSAAAAGPGPQSAQPSPFALRGVVEGFYGPPWTPAATVDTLAFMGAQGMNTFVYAPKNDPYQRADWQEPYPARQLADLQTLVQAATRSHITFVYSISPGLSIVYSSAADRSALEAKLAQLRGIGVHSFMLSFDDVTDHLVAPADVAAYGGSLSAAQVDLANALQADERSLDPAFSLMLTPTEYSGTRSDAYLRGLAALSGDVDVVWTGPGVLSPQLGLADAQAFGAIVGRRPVIWYNYPVNDWTVPSAQLNSGLQVQAKDLFMGPVQGLDPGLAQGVRGILANPMLQPYASQLPLASLAAYLNAPGDAGAPASAWQAALTRLGGPAAQALATFCAAESPYPALTAGGAYVWTSTDPGVDSLEATLLATFAQHPAAASPAAAQLRATFQSWIDAAPALAPGHLADAGLAADIQPWVHWMPTDGQAGLDALALLQAGASGSAARAKVTADLLLLAGQPVEFGGDLTSFLQGASAAAG